MQRSLFKREAPNPTTAISRSLAQREVFEREGPNPTTVISRSLAQRGVFEREGPNPTTVILGSLAQRGVFEREPRAAEVLFKTVADRDVGAGASKDVFTAFLKSTSAARGSSGGALPAQGSLAGQRSFPKSLNDPRPAKPPFTREVLVGTAVDTSL